MTDPIIRNDESGELDEFIASEPRSVHFERMSDGLIWCGVTLKDGTLWHVNVCAKGARGHVKYWADK